MTRAHRRKSQECGRGWTTTGAGRIRAGIAAVALTQLLGCTNKDVVAKVGGSSITLAELNFPRAAPDAASARKQLDALVPRALLAEGAREAGLDRDPQIAARISTATREILAQAYLDKKTEAETDEAAMRKLYDARKDSLARKQVHVAHIVVRHAAPGNRDAEIAAQGKINEIYAKVIGGEDFAKLAGERSEDAVSAQQGGDLAPLLDGQVDPKFFGVAAGLKKGEVSKPFETAVGWHVVKALADAQVVVPSFDEARGRLAADARSEAQAKLLERLRADVSVRIFEDKLSGNVGRER